MDLGVNSNPRSSGVRKQTFQLKPSRKDGLILQIHHTVPTANNEIHRVRFVHTSFDHTGEQLATADHRGNIFVIDLSCNKFWMLPNLGSSCTVLEFTPFKKNEILIGLKNCSLHFVNTELGFTTGILPGHTQPATQLSFSSDHRYCLSVSTEEAIIWDLKSNSLHYMIPGAFIKKVLFMPVSNNILACYEDDTMQVWKFETWEDLTVIVPESWGSHHLKSMAFTRDGRAMVVGGHTSVLVVFCLDSWTVKKVITLPSGISGVKHIEFLPQLFDGGANKVLGLLPGNSCSIHFFDIESSAFLSAAIEPECTITKFACSSNGKFIACILNSGEVNLYNSAKIFEKKHRTDTAHPAQKADDIKLGQHTVDKDRAKQNEGTKPQTKNTRRHTPQHHLSAVQNQIKATLDVPRLKLVLKEFGEYPASYRALIWKTILQVPHNQQSYVGLVNRDCHHSYVGFEEKFPLKNKALLKNLKRLLSCLANWSGVFGDIRYLPEFVFPFVKVFENDPFACFEVVTTIILNWCQHWFEYFPYPPIDVLTMVENILAEDDPELFEHFWQLGISSELYVWVLLQSAMSEVLVPSEWHRLWDHVVSNEPAFLLMAVVAYSVTSRATLLACHAREDFEYFYHNQNPVDMKSLITKSYQLCRKTSDVIHPRQYLKEFTPLKKGSYPIYNQFPKFILAYQNEYMNAIRCEEAKILREEQLALDLKIAQEKRIREELQTDVQADRLQKMEEMYRATLLEAEDRVAARRQKVTALRRELRSREVEILDLARDRLQKQHLHERGRNLDRLMDDVKRKQVREDTDLEATEEEMRRHYAELLTHKHELEQQLGTVESGDPNENIEHMLLQQKQKQLADERWKLREEASSKNHSRNINISSCVAKVEEMMQREEMELAREMIERQQSLHSGRSNLKTMHQQTKNKELEGKVEGLLQQLPQSRLCEAQAKMSQFKHSKVNLKIHQILGKQICCECDQSTYCPKQSQTPADRLYPMPDRQTRASGECKCLPRCLQTRGDLRDRWTTRQNSRGAFTSNDMQDSDYTSYSDKPNQGMTGFVGRSSAASIHRGLSERGYSRERKAVQAAMKVREQIVCGGTPSNRGRKERNTGPESP